MKWSVVQSDCIEWLSGLPDDHADLLFTSPPYMGARTYGIGFDMDAEEWTAWMLRVVRAASPKVRGLMAIVCEGQTCDYAYQPAPFLLIADLYRAGFNLRKPAVYERDGIPGSGGPDWLKNRWEPIVCVTRPGRMLWSEPTACGRPPKCESGGRPSYRQKNGERGITRRAPNGERSTASYKEPDIANPGNIIDCGADTHLGFGNENEAPFPLTLAEFFVRSFAPPGGLVIDPFCGSGTTGHAAIEARRRFAGCDVRESQVELTKRRLTSGITPDLFASETPT